MESSYTISIATPEHLEALADIEAAADTLFEGYLPASIPEVHTPQDKFHNAQREGRLWIALSGVSPVGFALVEMLAKDLPHLEEIDVLPSHGRRGIGTALIHAILDWLVKEGHGQITLTTFRSIPWNMPFYSNMGFVEIPTDELRPELERVVQNEASRGLARELRVVMQYRVSARQTFGV